MKSKKGYLVRIKETGKVGRTFHRKGQIGGKYQVYNEDHQLDERGESLPDQPEPDLHELEELEFIKMID